MKIALTVLLAAAVGSLSAASAAAQAPAGDAVVGTAQFGDPVFGPGATLDAHSGPQGENPNGNVRISARSNAAGGPVTCLTVVGNRATIGFDNAGFSGGGGFVFVEDNGTPGAGVDRLDFTLIASPPTACPIDPPFPLGAINSGDLTVTDAQAQPLSKDECKHGGYARF